MRVQNVPPKECQKKGKKEHFLIEKLTSSYYHRYYYSRSNSCNSGFICWRHHLSRVYKASNTFVIKNITHRINVGRGRGIVGLIWLLQSPSLENMKMSPVI